MRNKYLFSLCLITCISVFSCSGDLKFTLPEIEPLLSIQSFIDPDNEFQLIVTMAKPLQEQNIQMSRDCQVDIYENDLFFTRLNLDPSSFIQGEDVQRFLRFFPDSGLIFSEGREYKVEVKYPEFELVTAKTIKPKAIKIKEITSRQFTGEMPDWYYNTPWKLYLPDDHSGQIKRDTSLIEFTITFDDPSETADYYRIGVNMITTNPKPWNSYNRRLQYASLVSPDPCFMKFNYKTESPLYSGWNNPTTYEILWNDKSFNGEEHTIKILVPGSIPISGKTKYIISLYTLNHDYYKYMVDRWKYSKTEHDPFAEPISFFSNISNNCGIFAISSLDADTINF